MTLDTIDDVRGLTRTGIEIKKITNAWKSAPEGDRFTQALVTFLGSKTNKGTQRVYAFALTEFFNWYKQLRGYYPLPSNVMRADAVLFVKWLQERNLGVDDLRLAQDPERELDLAIYKFIKQKPESRISAIRQHLLADVRFTTTAEFKVRGTLQRGRVLKIEEDEPHGDALQDFIDLNGFPPDNALDLRLACLCMHNLLRRAPTIQQIRDGEVDVGVADPDQAQITFRVDPEVFRYWANTYTEKKGTDRSGTIATKLSALSSFWTWLVRSSGENLPGFDSLLRFNIWREVIANVRVTAINRAKAHREASTPDRELFLRVLSACYKRSHGADALQAASAALEGADVRRFAQAEPTIYDLRDRAILLFCYWTGVRAEELGSIRRTAYESATGLVTITGKGDLTRIIRTPDPAILAIREFQAALDARAEEKGATIFTRFIAEPDAPLFPPLKLWGRAARIVPTTSGALPGISPSGLAKLLHERSEEAGIEQGSDDYYRVHPHGLRHLAALEANRRGVDVATIQSTLGHGSLATTGIYLEVRDPMARSLQPDQPPRAPAPPEPITFDVEAEVAGEEPAAKPAAERVIKGALPPSEAREKPAAAKPTKPADERKRRIVSFETELKKSAASRAMALAKQAAETSKKAVNLAKDAAEAAAVVARAEETEGVSVKETYVVPTERSEEAIEVITPPEEAFEPLTEAEVKTAAEPGAVRKLLVAYRDNWGDASQRSHLVEQKSKAAREALGDPDEEVEEALLANAYVGKTTSFGWWLGMLAGMKDKFRYIPNPTFPAMPIVSPEQFSRGYPDDNPVLNRLVSLYDEWLDKPDRGPTACGALILWTRLAFEIGEEATKLIESRGGTWVDFDAPLQKQPDPKKPSLLREHLPGAIVAWFESTAWQWVPSTKSGKPTGDDFDPPGWYNESDPLASMPKGERIELLDWLRVLTGKPPEDNTPRFKYGASRAQLGKLIGLMCQSEALRQEQAEAAAIKGTRLDAATIKAIQDNNEIRLKADVKKFTDGAVADFSYQKAREKRSSDRQQAEVARAQALREAAEEKLDPKERRAKVRSAQKFSRMLRGFYLDTLATVFGDEVKKDPILDTQARCTQGIPLDEDVFKGLFRVKGDTIQHDPEFMVEYAKQVPQHSECVARRLARHLWESSRLQDVSESGNRDALLVALSLTRWPCPPDQEQDLRNKVGIFPGKRVMGAEFLRTQASAEERQRLKLAAQEGAGVLTTEELRELETAGEFGLLGELAAQSKAESEETVRQEKLGKSRASEELKAPPVYTKTTVRTRLGMKGPAVAKWQAFLKAEGLDVGSEDQGDERARLHGPMTEAATALYEARLPKATKNPKRRSSMRINPIKLLFASSLMKAAPR